MADLNIHKELDRQGLQSIHNLEYFAISCMRSEQSSAAAATVFAHVEYQGNMRDYLEELSSELAWVCSQLFIIYD